jgi:uroporphyrinogen III methyltransferase/synthase
MPAASHKAPSVYLVGAGPGDHRLLTLRGVECLGRADIVLYDYLVNPRLLEHARPGAELVCLGRHGHGRLLSQDEVNARIVRDAQAGKVVVRLKAGDPVIFARAAEEVRAVIDAGLTLEIVPGVTAAMAAGSHAGISLTDRRSASAVALVTGHEDGEKGEPALDYAALASFPGTLVFYMGVTTASTWSEALVAAGKPASTPVAVVRRCSWPDQQTIHATLGTVAQTIAERRLRPPAICIVGEVACWDSTTAWFASRPLSGRRIVVTRPIEQADGLRSSLEELGAEVFVQPAIRIEPPENWSALDATLARLESFDWIVFSSANGVRALLDRLCSGPGDLRRLAGARLAAIGSGTAAALADYRLKADLLPEEFRAEALAEVLIGQSGQRLLLVRASRGREVLAERLSAAGREVEQVVAYCSTDVDEPEPSVVAALEAGRIDFITVTSSAIARSLARLLGPLLARTKLVSISPITSATLRELGYPPAAEATAYTMDGVVDAILAVSGGNP